MGAVRGIGDHTAADRAADLLTPQPLTVGNIQSLEVAAHISEEDDASCRRGYAAQDWVIGLQPPLPDAGVGVGGVDPSRPISERIGHTVGVIGVDRRHSGPRLAGAYSLDTFVLLQRHRRAPIDFADEDEVT